MAPDDISEVVDQVYRADWGRIVATLIRQIGDFDLAEEVAQEAFVTALDRGGSTGRARFPRAWIVQTARNRAIDRFRRQARLQRKLGESWLDPQVAPAVIRRSSPTTMTAARSPTIGCGSSSPAAIRRCRRTHASR